MKTTLELRHLRVLLAVVEHGGYTRAARALGVAQSTVSESVAALERAGAGAGAEAARADGRRARAAAARPGDASAGGGGGGGGGGRVGAGARLAAAGRERVRQQLRVPGPLPAFALRAGLASGAVARVHPDPALPPIVLKALLRPDGAPSTVADTLLRLAAAADLA